MSVPTKLPPVYTNDRLIIYALAEDSSVTFDHNSNVELYTDQHSLSKCTIDHIPNVTSAGTIARLAAKALILELQHAKIPRKSIAGSMQPRFQHLQSSTTTDDEKETLKKRIIELSLKHQILCPYTAFIGVEKRTNVSNAEMVLREVPSQIPADDQHLQIGHSTMNDSDTRSGSSSSDDSNIFYDKNHSISMLMKYSAMSSKVLAMKSITSTSSDEDAFECRQSLPTKLHTCSVKSTSMVHRSSSSLSSDSDEDFMVNSSAAPQRMACSKNQPRASNRSSSSSSLDRDMIFDKCVSTVWKKQDTLTSSSHEQDDDDIIEEKEETWPTDDQDIVRYLINKQKFDGVWDLDGNIIEKLIGKPVMSFSSLNSNFQVLISAIVIIALETRFTSHSTIWHCVVQKARQRLLELLNRDRNLLDSLMENIRQQI
ncbi:unnamed protein product [Rotaria sp. Silwood2]|nr:unnamed protein product [Rotaria sp. Silwood2]